MRTNTDEEKKDTARKRIDQLVKEIHQKSEDATNQGLLDKEKYVIPPHLHDLQEADLPENQRGLVISEIAQFRERAAKREREKMRDVQVNVPAFTAPNGPKAREWGRPQQSPTPSQPSRYGKGSMTGFVKAEERSTSEEATPTPAKRAKTDLELEEERQESRRKEEERSFRDRERRYEPRERARITALERQLAREKDMKHAEEKDRIEMRERLAIWDDDESDESFYVDRTRWRASRARRLEQELTSDGKSRKFEEQEAENLRRESEAFLARQMDEMQALADEQRKAGLLLDDGAPVKLNVSLAQAPTKEASGPAKPDKATVFSQEEEEEEEATKRRKVPLVKLDFSVAETGEKLKERLENIRQSVPHDKESLFKAKVRWDGLSDTVIDRKFEPLVKRLMVKYLGEMEDDDLILFVLEHLKDHKGPQKLVEGLEPVLEEEAIELTKSVWRQIIFESMAYGEGLLTERMMVD
ncbi:hypothetical protein VKT23_001385 [Stygiomarasmius scandens]